MKTLSICVLLVAVIGLPARAQSMKPTAPVEAASISPSHRQAAETMLNLVTSVESYNQGIDQKLAMMFKQLPNNRDAQAKMRAFMGKYLSWESIRPELAALYAREFTEAELRELIRFYQTPVGRKMATLGPRLSQARMEIGQRRLQEHQAEFEQLFQER